MLEYQANESLCRPRRLGNKVATTQHVAISPRENRPVVTTMRVTPIAAELVHPAQAHSETDDRPVTTPVWRHRPLLAESPAMSRVSAETTTSRFPVLRLIGPLCGLVLLLILTSVGTLSAERDEPEDSSREVAEEKSTTAPTRLREGTKLENQLGYFQMTGDRATFITADRSRCFGGLENLNLARVVAMISDAPGKMEWSVTGTVTEFQGSNYLLISRAVLKTRAKSSTRRP